MTGGSQPEHQDYDGMILNCLEHHTSMTLGQIAQELGRIAHDLGNDGQKFPSSTVSYHLNKLRAKGKIRHQNSGFFIDHSWREGLPKAFVLVEISKPKKKGENYQKMLVNEIRDGFRLGVHDGVNLISVDVVLGAEFSVIVQIYSDHLHFIGKFVKEYLLPHEYVTNTRTIMVWPAETGLQK